MEERGVLRAVSIPVAIFPSENFSKLYMIT